MNSLRLETENAAYDCLNKRKNDETNRIGTGTSLKFPKIQFCLLKENENRCVAFDLFCVKFALIEQKIDGDKFPQINAQVYVAAS